MGVLVLAIACCGGCSSEDKLQTYSAVAEITYPNGQPIKGARVTFRSKENHQITARGKADIDGVCHLTTYESRDGAILGKHEVVIAPPVPKGDADEVRVAIIAPRFANYSSSGLEFTVTETEETNKFRIIVTPN